jgi:hypothetical protein
LDHLVQLSGERGAFRLLADVDEHTYAYEALRNCGFAIFSRQRIWQLTAKVPRLPADKAQSRMWKVATSKDAMPIRSLYNNTVPGLVQQVEPFQTQRPKGVVYYQDDELMAFVDLKYGRRGVWVQPFVHPDAQNISECFFELLHRISKQRSRPVYICVRSYQSWLEAAVENLGAEAGPRQAVMVRHLALPQKAIRAFALPALEGGQPEITTTISNTRNE